MMAVAAAASVPASSTCGAGGGAQRDAPRRKLPCLPQRLRHLLSLPWHTLCAAQTRHRDRRQGRHPGARQSARQAWRGRLGNKCAASVAHTGRVFLCVFQCVLKEHCVSRSQILELHRGWRHQHTTAPWHQQRTPVRSPPAKGLCRPSADRLWFRLAKNSTSNLIRERQGAQAEQRPVSSTPQCFDSGSGGRRQGNPT